MGFIKPVYIIMLVVPLIWSSNFVIGRILVQSLPPFTLTTVRFGIAAVILLLMLLYKGLLKPIPREVIIPVTLLGISGIFAFNTLLYIGLQYTTAINSTIINSFNPIAVAVLSALWLKDPVGIRQRAGLLLSLLGVVVVAVRGSWQVLVTFSLNPGDLLVFLGTLVWAFYTVMGKRVMAWLSPLQTTAYANFAGVIFLLPAMFWEWGGVLPRFTPGIVLILVYLAIFASVLGFLGWNRGVSEIGPARAAAFYNLIPIYGAVMACLLLGERLSLYHLVGGVMVLTGVYLGIREDKAPDTARENS